MISHGRSQDYGYSFCMNISMMLCLFSYYSKWRCNLAWMLQVKRCGCTIHRSSGSLSLNHSSGWLHQGEWVDMVNSYIIGCTDCPTDQIFLIWAFLGFDHYWIALHLNTLMTCITSHVAQVQMVAQTKNSSRFSFYDGLSFEEHSEYCIVSGDKELQENIDEDSIQLIPPVETTILQSTKMSKKFILKDFRNKTTISQRYWCMAKTV